MRTYIASNPRNRLSLTANSVPPECVWIICWLMIEALQTRIPQLQLTEDQKKQIQRAHGDLEKIRRAVSNNQYVISQPSDPEDDPAQTFSPMAYVVSSDERVLTRAKLQAL